MDKFIEAIVIADREARERVDAAQKYRRELQNHASSSRNEIYEEFMNNEKTVIEERKRELAQKMQTQITQMQESCEASLISLQKLYEENKDQWVKTIVDRCLHE